MTTRPETVTELQRVVRERPDVRVRGGGTKSPAGDDDVVLTSLSGILEYSPEECVFTAYAGTPLLEIEAALRAHLQYLPFDPPFADEGATIGGTVASGVSGPGRYRYGGVRDFLIGVRVVDGEGRMIRSGGKVVKNAAGFLLHHGLVGSCGRFGVITEVTFKVFPAPEQRRSLAVNCESVEEAFVAARRLESLRCDCEAIDFDEAGHLTVRIAGRATSLEPRVAKVAAAMGSVPATGVCPPPRLQTSAQATGPSSTVKVAGLMKQWPTLRGHVASARFMCAGAVAWLETGDVARLATALDEAQLVGQVIRGPRAGARIGHVVHNEFEERVRRVLDPRNRFSAASNSHH